MYELIPASGRTYYIDCPTKIGVFLAGENRVYLIDSGNKKDAGKKLWQILEQKGWRLQGILNTHSHADHIGGNRYLQEQTGCQVFARGVENAFTRYPVLEPSFLYGGCPPEELRHKFLMAQESDALEFSHPDFPRELESIPLPGHSLHMTGFRTPDNVVFLGDAVVSPATLEKYGVSYLYDVGTALHTLDALEQLEASLFVPSHAEPTTDISELVHRNREKILEVGDRIVSLCEVPRTAEELLKELFTLYGLTMTFEQHAMIGSTLRSYLTWLKSLGRLTAEIRENAMVWQAVPDFPKEP